MTDRRIMKPTTRYPVLDGLRVYAALGIIVMHVAFNGGYEFPGFIFNSVIKKLGVLVFLFMLLSAFSMCCGYYEKIRNNTLDICSFYKRRYQRIWPFFSFLCTIDLLINHDLNTLYEWFADITLAFGLIPNNRIEVVGVGWTIGVIFVFYMVFPFFVFLIENKKRLG